MPTAHTSIGKQGAKNFNASGDIQGRLPACTPVISYDGVDLWCLRSVLNRPTAPTLSLLSGSMGGGDPAVCSGVGVRERRGGSRACIISRCSGEGESVLRGSCGFSFGGGEGEAEGLEGEVATEGGCFVGVGEPGCSSSTAERSEAVANESSSESS